MVKLNMKLSLIRLILFQFEFIDSSVVEQREHSNHKLPFKKRKLESIKTDNISFLQKLYGKFQYPDMCETTNNSLINKTPVSMVESTTYISEANNNNSTNRDVPELNSPKNDRNIAIRNNHQYLIYMNIEGESSSKHMYSDEGNNNFSIGKNRIYLVKQVEKHTDTSSELAHIDSRIQFKTPKDWPRFLNEDELENFNFILAKLRNMLFTLGKEKSYKPSRCKFNRSLITCPELFVIMFLKIKNGLSKKEIVQFYTFYLIEFYNLNFDVLLPSDVILAKRIQVRHKIVELLKERLDNCDNKILLYEKLIELEEKTYYKEKAESNLEFNGTKYISCLYVIIFFLNDDEEVRLFKEQIHKFRENLGSPSYKTTLLVDLDFTGISIKKIFLKIYELAKVFSSNLKILKDKRYKCILNQFNQFINKIEKDYEKNLDFQLTSSEFVQFLIEFENVKFAFHGGLNKYMIIHQM